MTAPDTYENQQEWPQPKSQTPGCGWPLINLVGIFCLSSGAHLRAIASAVPPASAAAAPPTVGAAAPDVISKDETFSLPDAHPRSDRFRCGERGSKFLQMQRHSED